jgi:hypothetical protein
MLDGDGLPDIWKSVFYACCEEMADISFTEGLYRILTLAGEQLSEIGSYCEKTASAIVDAIMKAALQCIGLSKNNRLTVKAQFLNLSYISIYF